MLKRLLSKFMGGSRGHSRTAGTTPTHGTPGHTHQSPKAAAAKTAAREVKKAVNKH